MNFSLKTLAVAVTLAVTAAGAHADIKTGSATGGNGELFFNIWDASSSYTRGLITSIDSFQSSISTSGNLDLSWGADSLLSSWLSTADAATLKWNIVANDTVGANRLLTTYSTLPATKVLNNSVYAASTATTTFLNAVNGAMAGSVVGDGGSISAANSDGAAAGKLFKDKFSGNLTISNAGTFANNSYASGLSFMRIDAAANTPVSAVYNQYKDGTAVNAWFEVSTKTLHLAAAPIPEPSEYAMLLAGLGMIGFMAGRRNKRV